MSQSREELLEENRSLRRQMRSIASRKDWLLREIDSLKDRLERKEQFVKDNILTLKGGSGEDKETPWRRMR